MHGIYITQALVFHLACMKLSQPGQGLALQLLPNHLIVFHYPMNVAGVARLIQDESFFPSDGRAGWEP